MLFFLARTAASGTASLVRCYDLCNGLFESRLEGVNENGVPLAVASDLSQGCYGAMLRDGSLHD